MLFIGDVCLAKATEKFILLKGKNYPFLRIKDEFLKHDFVFANMESPISSRGEYVKGKPFTFEVDSRNAEYLKDVKLDVVSLSNNHLLDYGLKGMYDTISYLDDWGIVHTGAGRNLAEARRPAVLSFGHTRIYILAYCERPPKEFYAEEGRPGTAPLVIDDIIKDVREHKTRGNIVLVSLHWGIELSNHPRPDQVETAHRIIEAGADGIIGHHPHCPQGIEIYRGKPVIYSLGNFILGYYNQRYEDNIIVSFYYDGNSLERMEIRSITGKNEEMFFQPRVIEGERAERNLMKLVKISENFNTPIRVEGNRAVVLLKGKSR